MPERVWSVNKSCVSLISNILIWTIVGPINQSMIQFYSRKRRSRREPLYMTYVCYLCFSHIPLRFNSHLPSYPHFLLDLTISVYLFHSHIPSCVRSTLDLPIVCLLSYSTLLLPSAVSSSAPCILDIVEESVLLSLFRIRIHSMVCF
jgi:hypothetical protein